MPLKRLFPSTVLVVVLAVVLWLGLVVLLVTGVSDPTTMIPVLAVATGLLLVLLYGVQRWGRVRRWAYRSQALAGSLDSSHRACLIVSPDGEEIYANRAARDVFGPAHAPLEPLQGRAGNNEYSLGELKRLAAAAMAGGRRRSELPLMVDGEIRDWLLVEVRPVDHKGSVAWLAEDVSARYALEATLHREVEELYDFLDLLPVGCYAATSDGVIVAVNYRLAEWLGESATALVGRNLRDVFGILPNMEDTHTDLHLTGHKGERFRATALHSVYGRGGILHSRSVVIRALMPEQERNRALWQAEHRFHRLFDDAPVGIALVNQRGVITAANLALQTMLGTDSTILVGDPFTLYVAADQRTLAEQTFSKITGGSRVGEHLELRLTGQKEINAQIFFSPLWDDDTEQNLGAIVHCVDTTDHRLLEIQFAQSQKMQAMGQLAGGIAHDFNNLLTAIIGNCDLLLQRHKPGDPSFTDIMQVQNTAKRAAALVQQLLAFSRRQALQPRSLDVTAALADLSTMLRRLLGERVSLQINHGRQLGLVRVDPVRFDQVILNLAVNARDAMVNGGVLTIRTSLVMVDRPIQRGSETMPAGRYVLVEVTDTGTGIPREYLSRIFEPFFSTKEVGKGTGLGLSTVYGIIRQTGGFIFVASEEGSGTCFSIYLPQISAQESEIKAPEPDHKHQNALRPQTTTPTAPTPVTPSSDDLFSAASHAAAVDLTGSATVLLVEDEDAVRMFSSRALRSKGYTVLEAATAEQALSTLDSHDTIDVLISDVVMPGMDGVSLARQVRHSRPQIRVILISGYSEDMARNGLDPDDGIAFLPKPFSLKQLAQAVKTALES